MGAFLRSIWLLPLFSMTYHRLVRCSKREYVLPHIIYHSDRIFWHFHMLMLVSSVCMGHTMTWAGWEGQILYVVWEITKYGQNQKDAVACIVYAPIRGFLIASILSEKNEHHIR